MRIANKYQRSLSYLTSVRASRCVSWSPSLPNFEDVKQFMEVVYSPMYLECDICDVVIMLVMPSSRKRQIVSVSALTNHE